MKKFSAFVCSLLLLLAATAAMAYNITVTVGGVKYQGRSMGGQIEYRVNGQVVGYERNLGGTVTYVDGRNNILGSVTKLGNSYQFKNARGQFIGSVTPLGNQHIYKAANNSQIGSAVALGGKTEYRASNNASIGSADTNSMPLRPIPLEVYLRNGGAKKPDGLCLTRVTKVKPGSPAEQSGMQLGDFLITYKGKDWTQFDLQHSDQPTMHARMVEKVSATRDEENLVMIVYRPAEGERNHANGKILKLAPTQPGLKGFTYTTEEDCSYYTREGSKAYSKQMKEIYQNWEKENQ